MLKTIFIVDDNGTNLTTAEEVLEEHYRLIALSSAVKMFKALEKFTPDLILLDIEMPDMSGFEAMKRLKASDAYSHIPVIFLTGMSETRTEAEGFELGAVDFIIKPFSPPVLINRIKTHLQIDEIIRERTQELTKRTEQLVKLQNGLVYTLAEIVENRDQNTGDHIERTTVLMKLLINAMFEHGLYTDEMSNWDLDAVISSARLHDLGKISIPDSILNKPGKLTDEEFATMKTHATAGERIIKNAIEHTGDAVFLRSAMVIAGYHHEKWDGSGYERGLKGADIPLLGRLMAIIDVYDALVTERPYKKAFSHEEALGIIRDSAGSHFDPMVAEVFIGIGDSVERLYCN